MNSKRIIEGDDVEMTAYHQKKEYADALITMATAAVAEIKTLQGETLRIRDKGENYGSRIWNVFFQPASADHWTEVARFTLSSNYGLRTNQFSSDVTWMIRVIHFDDDVLPFDDNDGIFTFEKRDDASHNIVAAVSEIVRTTESTLRKLRRN